MKFLYFLAFTTLLTGQEVVCGGFPPAALGDLLQLINQNLDKKAPAPIKGNHAVISVGTVAISTKPSPGQHVTLDYLAQAANAIYEVCDAPDISGFRANPTFARVCVLESRAFALC